MAHANGCGAPGRTRDEAINLELSLELYKIRSKRMLLCDASEDGRPRRIGDCRRQATSYPASYIEPLALRRHEFVTRGVSFAWSHEDKGGRSDQLEDK